MLTNFQSKYKVLCKIGEGSFSEVLKCQNRETGQMFAAKRLKKTFQCSSDVMELPELIAMTKLKHQNILTLIEPHFEQQYGKVTLIFELMDMSIYDMMKNRKRPFPESRVKNYLYQILKGVDFLHSAGIFHRDIKPENILIKGEVIKIADLGSVRGIFSHRPYTEYISTRWYRSPECLLTNGYYNSKMDIWATGCVFYELLTLKPLFPGANELDQIAKIHTVLGTPSPSLLNRFKKHKSQNTDMAFPMKLGTGFGPLLQNISDTGREILKMMLTYDPKIRSAARRLLENRYFNDLREADLMRRRVPASHSTSSATEWRNPVLLSFMTSDKKRKPKPSTNQQQQQQTPKLPKPVQIRKIKSPIKQMSLSKTKSPLRASLQKITHKTTTTCLQSKQAKLLKRERVTENNPIVAVHPVNILQDKTNAIKKTSSSTNVNTPSKAILSATSSFLPGITGKAIPIPKNGIRKNNASTYFRQQHLGNNTTEIVSNKNKIVDGVMISNLLGRPKLEPILEHAKTQTTAQRLGNAVNNRLIRNTERKKYFL